MVAAPDAQRLTGVSAGRALSRRYQRAVRRLRESELAPALLLLAACVLIGVSQYVVPGIPLVTLVIPMVIGNLGLGPRTLPWFIVFALGVLVIVVAATPSVLDGRRIGGVVVIFLIGLIILVSSFRRTRLGVAGVRGESMLVDLRDRIHSQAQLPALPRDWYAESVLRSAGGTSFAGDFLVASRSSDGTCSRSRSSTSPARASRPAPARCCSPARSAACSARCPATGSCRPPTTTCCARTGARASRPPSTCTSTCAPATSSSARPATRRRVQLHAGSGRWAVHESEGPVLGLIEDARVHVRRAAASTAATRCCCSPTASSRPPQRDISLGIDKLLGQGERLLRAGFEGGAQRLIDPLESDERRPGPGAGAPPLRARRAVWSGCGNRTRVASLED